MIPASINEKDFRYSFPTEQDLISQKRELDVFISNAMQKLNLKEYPIEINNSVLGGILVRIDERKDYYKYFHSSSDTIMTISKAKELALAVYWIIRYKPFRIKEIKQEEEFYYRFRCSINEVISAFMIIYFVTEVAGVDRAFFTDNKINVLIYDLYNRDISKEAMIMYIESFISDSLVA